MSTEEILKEDPKSIHFTFICSQHTNEFPLTITFYQTFSLYIALPSVASGFITQLMGIISVPFSYLRINEWAYTLFQAQDKYSVKAISMCVN